MKKNLLLMMLCCPAMLAAQNGVTVSGLAVDAGTVTFDVSWNKDNPSDTVWVFVDYNDAGVMKRLPVTDASVSAGTVTKTSNNDKGVWVEGNARTNDSFSAKVELFSEIKDIAGACAYASNYPPVGEYLSATEISFTGTPEYHLILEKIADGSTYTIATTGLYSIHAGEAIQSFTDKTGAPGVLVPATYTLSGSDGCEGTDVTLTLSGSQNEWRYQLYNGVMAVGNVVNGTGSALAFSDAPAVGGHSYTVRTVDNSAVTAQRAMQVSNVRTITVNPLPTISLTGGAASQIVNYNTTISPITYMASNATSMTFIHNTLSAGGLSGSVIDLVATISGTPSAAGTYSYTVATTNSHSCTDATASGQIVVRPYSTSTGGPNTAISTTTWIIGSQTWTNRIVVAPSACTHSNTTSELHYSIGQYMIVDNRYYYNWTCVNRAADVLCPSPWHVPTLDDANTLAATVDGYPMYPDWGGVTWVDDEGFVEAGSPRLWTSDEIDTAYAWQIRYNREGTFLESGHKRLGFQVRCVK
jgi:hypothetical protein